MTTQDYQKLFHETKNQITFINSSLQLIEKKCPDIQSISYWNDAMDELSSLKKMLIELSSARMSDTLDLQKVSLENFLIDFMSACIASFDSIDFNCKLEIEPLLPEISIDCDRFRRALFHLIKNSYEAMNSSGTIYLTVHRENDTIRLDLTDFGGGIDNKLLPNIFLPLETTKPNGTGLGLNITKQIIEAHGGHLMVESRPNDGCTFSIILPYPEQGGQVHFELPKSLIP